MPRRPDSHQDQQPTDWPTSKIHGIGEGTTPRPTDIDSTATITWLTIPGPPLSQVRYNIHHIGSEGANLSAGQQTLLTGGQPHEKTRKHNLPFGFMNARDNLTYSKLTSLFCMLFLKFYWRYTRLLWLRAMCSCIVLQQISLGVVSGAVQPMHPKFDQPETSHILVHIYRYASSDHRQSLTLADNEPEYNYYFKMEKQFLG